MADPYDMPTNPYMAPMPTPDWRQVLSNALIGVGAGISGADSSGRGWGAGIAPGLMMGANLTGQQQQNAWQRQMQGLQYQSMLDHRRAQDEATHEKTAMLKANRERDVSLGKQISDWMGLRAPENPVQMMAGVTDPASRIAGIESAGQPNGGYGAVGPVANSRGNRAYGRYQVMDFNVGPWTKEVLGNEMSPQEFLQNPQAQDAVFKAKFGQASRQYGGDEAAARWWFAGPGGMNNPTASDVNGMTVARYSDKFTGGRPPVAQGDAIAGQGDAPGSPQNAIANLPPEVRAGIAIMAQRDPEKAVQMMVQALQNQKKEDAWTPLSPESAKMFNLDPAKSWQMNKVTRKIEQVGGAQTVVNIDQKGEIEFAKEVGKNDAKRLKDIQDAEAQMSDFSSKIKFAVDQLGETYTGTGAEGANAFFKALGSFGFEEAAKKANAAAGAQAIIAQMKPSMRAAGSGASSDKDMDIFATALPALVNLPGGNQRIAAYFEKLSARASKIRELAEEHSQGGTKPLTGTQFAAEVKKLGDLFTPEERKELMELGKKKPAETPKDRKPLDQILGGANQNMTPAPAGSMQPRKPLGSILGAP